MAIDLKETKKKLEEAKRLQEQYEAEIRKAELEKQLETFCDDFLKNKEASDILKSLSKDEVKIVASEVAVIFKSVVTGAEPKLAKLRATKEAKAQKRKEREGAKSVPVEQNTQLNQQNIYNAQQ